MAGVKGLIKSMDATIDNRVIRRDWKLRGRKPNLRVKEYGVEVVLARTFMHRARRS